MPPMLPLVLQQMWGSITVRAYNEMLAGLQTEVGLLQGVDANWVGGAGTNPPLVLLSRTMLCSPRATACQPGARTA